jgi:hypothetical protein
MPVPVVAKIRIIAGRGTRTFPLLIFVALAGCMTLGDAVPPPQQQASLVPPPLPEIRPATVVEPVAPSLPAVPAEAVHKPAQRQTREVRAAPMPRPQRERPAPVDPDALIGLEPAAVQRLLGAPSRVQDDKLSREWVYASPGCDFRIFFYPVLNAASFRVLKYGGNDDNGGRLAASHACVRRILTARANAAD